MGGGTQELVELRAVDGAELRPRGRTRRRVLWVDDEVVFEEPLTAAMKRRDFDLTWARSADEALALLVESDFDAVVTDLQMDGMHGLELCARVVAMRPDCPVIVATGCVTFEASVAAIRAGAYDFVSKPFDLEYVRTTLVRAIQACSLRDEVKRLRCADASPLVRSTLRGASAPMIKVRSLVDRVASTEAVVLISGESGTGKELVAQSLHAGSRRAAGPFIAINCAAMPESLLESELFGHARGAFTDARTAHRGLFVQANGGTLFLDEIGEMPLGVQAKLLRALQERKVRPIGGDAEERYDARIIAASNRDLEAQVKARQFREDLFYRLDVVRIALPSLRSRGEDVLALAQHFLERYALEAGRPIASFSAPFAERLLAYPWPGNVRELQNCIQRAVALAQFEVLGVDDLPDRIRDYRHEHFSVPGISAAETPTIEEVERRYIQRVLAQTKGSRTAAATLLGVDRRTLHRKLGPRGC